MKDIFNSRLLLAMRSDQHRLRRRWEDLQRRGASDELRINELLAELEASVNRRQSRANAKPMLTFDDQLPINQHREKIAAAIAQSQVLIICGETGSGKTTQLPKICMELGRGVSGMIGHTQPRRIAARTVAERIAQELDQTVGNTVGYKVRFTDHVSANSLVKVMTDGILLAETQSDRFLDQYDTLIIDEAHERSLNIDFLLGYIKRLLPRRPDLKVIVTSATIDPETLSRHFDNAPIIEVSGRTYPVEIRYRPPEDDGDDDWALPIVRAVDELLSESPGDSLVFVTGEREIRDASHALHNHFGQRIEILPLYARLSVAEQRRVFASSSKPRVVLSTNVAETSLTVPGIRYVIDAGLARINRYSYRTKVQRLPIEKISQASANQRAGRCGRVSAGVCIRLYDHDDYQSRPLFTDPEIRRTNLAAVILQMMILRLGDINAFPFLEAPDQRYINDGYRLLQELGALDVQRQLTEQGRMIARLPIDPRLARSLIAAAHEGCLAEALIVVSALSIQDPRERPMEASAAADNAHRQDRDERSDFLTLVNLWRRFANTAKELTRNKLKQFCKAQFLSYRRMQEWQEIHQQLGDITHEMNLRLNQNEAEYASLHRALLSGFLSQIATKGDEREFLGARGLKPVIFPGSGLAKKAPKWIFAAELVETQRLYARYCAQIDPHWIEPLAKHLVKKQYFEPHWETKAGQVVAREQVTLYGLVIVAGRRASYGAIDPVVSREIFIRSALVNGEVVREPEFLRSNRELLSAAELVEAKTRRRDVVVDEETLYQFYADRIPVDIYSWQSFERWRSEAERSQPRLLYFSSDDVMRHNAEQATAHNFPDHLLMAATRLPLHYLFEPAREDDGVTIEVPLSMLNQLDVARMAWLVPGLLRDKVIALIRSLPKALRKNFVPAPEFADAAIARMQFGVGDLLPTLGETLFKVTGTKVGVDDWDSSDLPRHLLMNVRVLDAEGKTLAQGRDVVGLRKNLGQTIQQHIETLPANAWQRVDLTRWSFGDLPESVAVNDGSFRVVGYPALVNAGDSVNLTLLDDLPKATQATMDGLIRLCQLELATQVKYLRKNIPQLANLGMCYMAVGKQDALVDDILFALFREVFLAEKKIPRSEIEFRELLEHGRGQLVEHLNAMSKILLAALQEFRTLHSVLSSATPAGFDAAYSDMRSQLQRLVFPGFLRRAEWAWVKRYPIYLKAMQRRLAKLREGTQRDTARIVEYKAVWDALCSKGFAADGALANQNYLELRWMVEELRVSLFAQDLGTVKPVSGPRLRELAKQIRLT